MGLRRLRGALNVRRDNAPEVLDRAKLMDKGPEDHPDIFATPDPPGPVFKAQIVVTDAAQVLVSKGGKGVASARDVQLGILHGMMERRLLYLQGIADTGTQDNARSVFHAGGVDVIEFNPHSKPILAAMQAFAGAPVALEANASALLGPTNLRRKHLFCWGYTLDGKTFISLAPTPKGRTKVTGLTPLTTVGFRVAVTPSDGEMGPWSTVINLLIQ